MSDNTGIEWTDATWNPTTGCTKVSPGCDHCYAEGIFNRFNGPGAYATGQLRPARLAQPFRRRTPRRVFDNSMSDLFHDAIDDEYIAQVFAVMAATPRHTYQVLTKRHGRMRTLLNSGEFFSMVGDHAIEACGLDGIPWPLPNVWLGVSVEDQKWADIRVPALLETPAIVRFLSCEPLLGPVRLGDGALNPWTCWWCRGRGSLPGNNAPVQGFSAPNCWHCNGDGIDGRIIHWVIVGGESGNGARPMQAEWARTLRDECVESGGAFFFKQAGAVLAREWGCTDRKGHNPDEWPEPFPRQMPDAAVPA
jgi:protein gp37